MAWRIEHTSLGFLVLMLAGSLRGQTTVGYDRLLNAAREPQNWLTYGGDYSSHHFSPLTQITPANVKTLSLAWVYQSAVAGSWESTPLVVDGIMYVTQRPNDIVALDAATCLLDLSLRECEVGHGLLWRE
jgi:glucose dehydrogenase